MVINNTSYTIPMVIEESSVVAACSSSAKFWSKRGGFRSSVVSTKKVGQVHFLWKGNSSRLEKLFSSEKENLLKAVLPLAQNMIKRGGGVKTIELKNLTSKMNNYYQLFLTFETCDAMGANFINSVLEIIASKWSECVKNASAFSSTEREIQIIMSILSNYTPECLVYSEVCCPVNDLLDSKLNMSGKEFGERMANAVKIAKVDPYRATTHNKGIFNGIDAVVLATGNDFRAIEACGHTFAARDGSYRGLTDIDISEGEFKLSLRVPLSLGTVGGLTSLHPLAKFSLDLLGGPSASELMTIIGCVGLAQNFGALRSLVTTGIQKGHMKMHLLNILNRFEATEKEREIVKKNFRGKTISFSGVQSFLNDLRKYH